MNTRQQRRARERHLVRKSMNKTERRTFVRMKNPLKREVYTETLQMIMQQFMQGDHTIKL